MSVISVINHKGGVAKTTTSINVAANWSEMGRKVLVIDLDPQSSATRSVFGDRSFDRSVYDLLTLRNRTTVDIRDCIYHSEEFGFDMIPSEIMLSGVDVELSAQFGREQILKKQISRIQNEYDSIIIDCSPSLGLLTVNALLASKDVIIPICPEYFSIKGIELILDTLQNLRKGLGKKINVRGIVITKYKNRRVINDVIAQVKQAFGLKVYDNFVPENIAIEEAHHKHLPVFKHDPQCKGALAYMNLSKEIWS